MTEIVGITITALITIMIVYLELKGRDDER